MEQFGFTMCPKNGKVWIDNSVIGLTDASGIVNSVELDQTAPVGAV